MYNTIVYIYAHQYITLGNETVYRYIYSLKVRSSFPSFTLKRASLFSKATIFESREKWLIQYSNLHVYNTIVYAHHFITLGNEIVYRYIYSLKGPLFPLSLSNELPFSQKRQFLNLVRNDWYNIPIFMYTIVYALQYVTLSGNETVYWYIYSLKVRSPFLLNELPFFQRRQ